MLSGLIGVPLGSFLAQHYRKIHQRTDPLICAWALFISAPFVYVALLIAQYSNGWCFFVIFLAELSLNLCWSIVADILLVSKTAFATSEYKQHNEQRGGKLTIIFFFFFTNNYI